MLEIVVCVDGETDYNVFTKVLHECAEIEQEYHLCQRNIVGLLQKIIR